MTPIAIPERDSFTETHKLMDVVDTLRHTQQDIAKLAGDAYDDQILVKKVLEIYASQGLPVDEATVQKGLEMLKSKRFEFTPPAPGLSVRLAGLYVSRSQWGPVLALRSALTTGAVAIALGMIALVGHWRYSHWEQRVDTAITQEGRLERAVAQGRSEANGLETPTQAVIDYRNQANAALDQIETILIALPALPAQDDAQRALYEADRTEALAVVEAHEAALANTEAPAKAARDAIAAAQTFLVAFRKSNVFDQAVANHLEPVRATYKAAFLAAAETSDQARMNQAVDGFSQTLRLDRQREALLAQIDAASGTAVAELRSQVEEAKALIVSSNLPAAAGLLEDVSSKLTVLPLSYELRIVSEAGERTGVWRYYGNDRSARNYYLIVDAVDASGNKVSLPITNVETKRVQTTSRFGVRVPEAIYNRVGEDKQSDGIVDEDLLGQKRAGELEPTYLLPVEGGFITEW